MTHRRPRILFISMYPLGTASSGPTVRIRNLLDELERRGAVEIIDGYRLPAVAR